jgi:hypothetical protein
MKKRIIFLVVVALLLIVIPVSAKPKTPIGDRLNIWAGGPGTFPADQPFHIKHGWILTLPDEAPIGMWGFELEVDGVLTSHDFISQQIVGHRPTLVEKYFVFNFPAGMTGTHTFIGHWYGRCQEAVDAGLYPGPCESKHALVEYGTFTAVVDFVSDP